MTKAASRLSSTLGTGLFSDCSYNPLSAGATGVAVVNGAHGTASLAAPL